MTEQNNDIRNTFGGIAEQYHQLRRRVEKIERSPADLRNAAIDGGRGLTIKSDSETIRFGDNGVEHLEGPAPEQPEAPFVDLGGESVKVQLSGLDAYGYPAQRNFKQAHIHVSQEEAFAPSSSTFAGYVPQADGSMTHRLPGGEWHVGVVWENMSGALSPMSDTTLADVAPLVYADEIQSVIDDAKDELEEAVQEYGNREGTTPPVDPAPDGVIYYQRESDDGPVVAVWQYRDDQWHGLPLTDAVLTAVTTDKLVAGESLIDGVLIKDGAVTAEKITVTEQLTAAIAQFLEIEAGMIKANAVNADAIDAGAIETDHLNGRIIKGEHIQGNTFTGETFDGGTFTGSTFQTDSLPNHGMKFSADGIHGWDDNGQKTLQITGELAEDMTNLDAGNFLTGRFYTNGAGKPGAILNPDYGPDSNQGPGIWFSQSGRVGPEQPAIWAEKVPGEADGMWWLNIRSKREANGGRNPIRMIGGVDVQEGGLIVGSTVINDDGTIDAGRDLSVWGSANFNATAYFNSEIINSGVTSASATANVNMTSSGRIRKTSSVRRSKVNIEPVDETHPERILNLYPRIWLDRAELQDALEDKYSSYVWAGNQYSGPTADEDAIRNHLGVLPRRIPGLVAEEVVEAGLAEYATYDRDSETGEDELSGIAYDRLWTLLIPLVREQRDKIKSQEERISDLEARLARLEAKLA